MPSPGRGRKLGHFEVIIPGGNMRLVSKRSYSVLEKGHIAHPAPWEKVAPLFPECCQKYIRFSS